MAAIFKIRMRHHKIFDPIVLPNSDVALLDPGKNPFWYDMANFLDPIVYCYKLEPKEQCIGLITDLKNGTLKIRVLFVCVHVFLAIF